MSFPQQLVLFVLLFVATDVVALSTYGQVSGKPALNVSRISFRMFVWILVAGVFLTRSTWRVLLWTLGCKVASDLFLIFYTYRQRRAARRAS